MRTWAVAALQVLLTRNSCISGFIQNRRVLLKSPNILLTVQRLPLQSHLSTKPGLISDELSM